MKFRQIIKRIGLRRVALLYKHPCYIGFGEYDHWFRTHSDSVGDGINSINFAYRKCEQCGSECEADDIDDSYDYEHFFN